MASSAWDHFVKTDDKFNVQCKVCEVQVNRKDSNTSSMLKHLKRKHSIDLSAQKKKAKSNEQQLTLKSAFEATKPFSEDHIRQKKITHTLANFIAVDMQPLDVVNDSGFRELIKVLEPR